MEIDGDDKPKPMDVDEVSRRREIPKRGISKRKGRRPRDTGMRVSLSGREVDINAVLDG